MGCFFIILGAFAPRIALIFLWLFTPLVFRAFGSFIAPLIGLILLPFTTLIYVLVYIPGVGLTSWGWFWVILALLIDIGTYSGGAYGYRKR
jgi:hypothetical protein